MRLLQKLTIGAVMLVVLAGSQAWAYNTNYWQSSGGYGGDFTNAAHWSLGSPTWVDTQFFTNQQATPYTVTFSTSVTNGPIQVYDDRVTFDLSGYTWTNNGDSGFSPVGIGSNSAFATTVKFSSSTNALVAGGNVVRFGTALGGNGFTMSGMVLSRKYQALFPWAIYAPSLMTALLGLWLWKRRLHAK